jgi:hypothetical protein
MTRLINALNIALSIRRDAKIYGGFQHTWYLYHHM